MLRQALLLVLLIGVVVGNPVSTPEKHQVIIVGAGVSGFTAAATLLEHNVTDVLLLEAADRIGGRINTVEFGGVYLDKGAEFVHGEGGNSVYELIKPYDFLTSYKATLKSDAFIFTNTSRYVYNSSFIKDLLDEAYNVFDDEDLLHFNGSVADYFFPKLDAIFQSHNLDPHLREALHYLVPLLELTDSTADDLSQLGAYGFADCKQLEGDITLKWKSTTKGYKTLFDVLSKKFPNPSEELPVVNKTLLGKQVTRVERKDGGVELTCTDGSTYLADHVIVTVSLGILKKHATAMFHPALSPEKTTAIETLGFGCLGKVFLLFPTKWWPDDKRFILPIFSRKELEEFSANSEHASWSARITGFEQVINHDRMLYVWLSGKACRHLDSLTEEQITDGLMELLNKLVGDKFNIPRPESILRSGWATYPHTLGSYSYRSVESDRLNITNEVLAEPILDGDKPVILFAGEATNRDNPSLVNGALDSGRREARNLINYLSKKA